MAVKEALAAFSGPQGPFATFAKIYGEHLSNIPEGNVSRAYTILRVMAASSRRLTLDEVAETAAIDVENETFDYERRSKDILDFPEDVATYDIVIK